MSDWRLFLSGADRRRLAVRAVAAFPEECCGILVGRRRCENDTVVSRLVATANVSRERERRFEIAPREVLRVERGSRAAGEQIVGFYHSHPRGGGRLSSVDREHAWPGASYLIVAQGGALASWRCRADGTVVSEVIADTDPREPRA
jgi:proteasome lid subunit RPN8/RPN11